VLVAEVGLAGLQRFDLGLGRLKIAPELGLDCRNPIRRLGRIDRTDHHARPVVWKE
jgi:hypothetical protein